MKIEALFSAKNHRLEMFDRGSATATREMSANVRRDQYTVLATSQRMSLVKLDVRNGG